MGLKEIKRTRYVLLIALALENSSDLRAGVFVGIIIIIIMGILEDRRWISRRELNPIMFVLSQSQDGLGYDLILWSRPTQLS